MSFLTQEAFNRADAPGERMSGLGKYGPCVQKKTGYLCKGINADIRSVMEDIDYSRSQRVGDLGCACNPTMGDLGCAGCAGDCKGKGFGDLGLDPADPLAQFPALKPVTAEVAQVSAVVSPYLWIFSIVGFGLALLNTSRVDKMWKRFGGSKWKGIKKPNF